MTWFIQLNSHLTMKVDDYMYGKIICVKLYMYRKKGWFFQLKSRCLAFYLKYPTIIDTNNSIENCEFVGRHFKFGYEYFFTFMICLRVGFFHCLYIYICHNLYAFNQRIGKLKFPKFHCTQQRDPQFWYLNTQVLHRQLNVKAIYYDIFKY